MYRCILTVVTIIGFIKVGQCWEANQKTATPEELLQLAHKMIETIESIVNDSRTATESNFDVLARFCMADASSHGYIMEAAEQKWTLQLNSLKIEASNRQVDISSCLMNDEKTLTKLLTFHVQKMLNCYNGLLGTAKKNLEQFYSTVNTTLEECSSVKEEVATDINECKRLKNLQCLEDLKNEFANYSSELYRQVTMTLEESLRAFQVIKPKALKCGTDYESMFERKSKPLVKKIFSCIKSKI